MRHSLFRLKFCEAETLRDFFLGKTGSQIFSPPGPWTGEKIFGEVKNGGFFVLG